MHKLDGAYERINGARENLDGLKPIVNDFAQVVAKGVSLDYKEGFRDIKGKRVKVPIGTASALINQPSPPKLSRLVGYVVQDLRTALEYLVYELACFDAKANVDMTQFVIADSEEEFRKNKWHLRGLTGEHIAAFERLQPYNGHQWTGMIRDLSNPDKHRHLLALKSPVTIRIDPRNTQEILAGRPVDVGSYATTTIAFSDGTPIIEGLEHLTKMTAETLDNFKPEFK
ncbi:MAG: hypothetical protein HY261_08230 [Chloroflexi bacterium]|nr:hypothetical protein [Chloroflexota bacterium]